jgi:hypothetical protein
VFREVILKKICQNDKQVFSFLLDTEGTLIALASDELKDDVELALLAVGHTGNTLQ